MLKIAGAAGARKAKSGYFLFPAGFAGCHRRGLPAVTDDAWIDFADSVYLKWVLAVPDLAESRVRIRATPTGRERIDGLRKGHMYEGRFDKQTEWIATGVKAWNIRFVVELGDNVRNFLRQPGEWVATVGSGSRRAGGNTCT